MEKDTKEEFIFYRTPKYDPEDWVETTLVNYGRNAPDAGDAENCADHFYHNMDGWEVASKGPWVIDVKVRNKTKTYRVHVESQPMFTAFRIPKPLPPAEDTK